MSQCTNLISILTAFQNNYVIVMIGEIVGRPQGQNLN